MSVYLAYATVIVIWGTTPLAIKLSNHTFTPMASVSLRFALAIALALPVCWMLKRGPFLNRRHWKLYAVSAIGIFPNMPLVYYAVQYIPSGLVAVLFGLTPFITGLLAKPLLGEQLLTREKLLALTVSSAGLFMVFREQVAVNEGAGIGLVLMGISALLFSFSNVLVRRVSQQLTKEGEALDSFQQTCGSMVFALPGLLLAWFFSGSGLPETVSNVSLGALLYLAAIASVVGFVAYFHVLTTMSMGLVSLIPLLTPILAMLIGTTLANETLTPSALLGCGVILLGLGWYQGVFKYLSLSRRHAPEPIKPAGQLDTP